MSAQVDVGAPDGDLVDGSILLARVADDARTRRAVDSARRGGGAGDAAVAAARGAAASMSRIAGWSLRVSSAAVPMPCTCM